MPWELGVPGAAEGPPPFPPAPAVPPPLELSLLFWPVESCERFRETLQRREDTVLDTAAEHNVFGKHCTAQHFFLSGSTLALFGYLLWKMLRRNSCDDLGFGCFGWTTH